MLQYNENKISYLENNEEKGYILYNLEDNNKTINVTKTYVDSSMRGKGIANILVQAIYNYAIENKKSIIPTCSYVNNWFIKNKDKQNVLKNGILDNPRCSI